MDNRSVNFYLCTLKRAQFDPIITILSQKVYLPGRVVQSVTCLATDASLTADPGVPSSIPAQSHIFVD